MSYTPFSRRVLVLFTLAAAAACRTASPGSPATVQILQPGAPGQDTKVIGVAAATDLSKVRFTAADTKFMQGMIGHHAQAVEMVALIGSRTQNQYMKMLGQRIDISQADEMNMMRKWLEVRGQAIPGPHSHHEPGGMMPGMLTADEMTQLGNAKGVEFDRLFLMGMIYGSGTGGVRSGEELQDCSGGDPKDNPNTALFSIDVIEVPLGAPEKARVVNRPRIFADEKSGAIAGLFPGGDHGPGTQRTSTTNQCHDITVFPEVGLAAGACSGNGILMDISDPANPKRLDHVADKNFAYWHSATFNNDGTKVIFTDEWGGGTRPRCRATDLPNWGANAIFDIIDKKLKFAGYYKMPAAQTETENCVAHNGSLIPVPGRDIMVQGWYQGGVSVFDFTDSANPVEIAYFDRGPLDAKNLIVGGYWSTYWYNGSLYGSEIARGMDIFKLLPTQYLSQNEIDAAVQWRATEFNAQNQPLVKFEPTSVVARAYLDQLNRSKSISAERAKAVSEGLAKVDELRTGKERNAAEALTALDAVAAQVEGDAKTASGRDAMRLKALAETLKGRAASLR